MLFMIESATLLVGPSLDGISEMARGLRRSVHGQIAQAIGQRIIAGEYAPGSILPTEDVFSNSFAVSRTSLREAIKGLAAKGLVESRPKIGTRVRPRAQWNMLDPDVSDWAFSSPLNRAHGRALFELRQIIEPAAAALSAERRDKADLASMREGWAGMAAATSRDEWIGPDLRFHQAILASTRNDLLISLGHLLGPSLTHTFAIVNVDARRRAISVPRHRDILLAIERRDPGAARAAMALLLQEALVDLEEMLEIESQK
jgi:DNA-binding FadR family transcriptional regulator